MDRNQSINRLSGWISSGPFTAIFACNGISEAFFEAGWVHSIDLSSVKFDAHPVLKRKLCNFCKFSGFFGQ